MLAFLVHNAEIDHLLETWGVPGRLPVRRRSESLGVPFPGETILILASLYAGTTDKLSIDAIS